jgi:hypothetical protein
MSSLVTPVSARSPPSCSATRYSTRVVKRGGCGEAVQCGLARNARSWRALLPRRMILRRPGPVWHADAVQSQPPSCPPEGPGSANLMYRLSCHPRVERGPVFVLVAVPGSGSTCGITATVDADRARDPALGSHHGRVISCGRSHGDALATRYQLQPSGDNLSDVGASPIVRSPVSPPPMREVARGVHRRERCGRIVSPSAREVADPRRGRPTR